MPTSLKGRWKNEFTSLLVPVALQIIGAVALAPSPVGEREVRPFLNEMKGRLRDGTSQAFLSLVWI